jgi:hypothetical protein
VGFYGVFGVDFVDGLGYQYGWTAGKKTAAPILNKEGCRMFVKVSKDARYFTCPVCGQKYEVETDEYVNTYGVEETLVCISPNSCRHFNNEYEETGDWFIFYFKP